MLKTVPVHELHEQLEVDLQTVLIDVRTEVEFASGHVARAQNIPLGSMMPAQVAAEWGRTDEGKPIFIISQSGVRAQRFVEELEQAGFEGALCVAGGTSAWLAAGLTMEQTWLEETPASMERIASVASGVAALAGCALGMIVHKAFFAVPITLGLLELIKGLTGRNVLARLLRHLRGCR
jgi:rhodanese-related sulfurtransferase